jgi:hypothetical protein
MDLGRDPWALIGQMTAEGRLLVHEEIASSNESLAIQLPRVRGCLNQPPYQGRLICIVIDPAGGAKTGHDERTSKDVIQQFGFACVQAPTNHIDPRLHAVEKFLTGQRGGIADIMINRTKCPTLCRALASGYRFSFTSLDVAKPLPDKNDFSHVADALQYLCLGVTGNTAFAIARKLTRKATPRVKISAQGWT